MQRLAMSRDISRLKSQLLMANSKQGRLVRSERLRLTRTASVAGGAAMLELTVDNIHELGDETKQKVAQGVAPFGLSLLSDACAVSPGWRVVCCDCAAACETTGACSTRAWLASHRRPATHPHHWCR